MLATKIQLQWTISSCYCLLVWSPGKSIGFGLLQEITNQKSALYPESFKFSNKSAYDFLCVSYKFGPSYISEIVRPYLVTIPWSKQTRSAKSMKEENDVTVL